MAYTLRSCRLISYGIRCIPISTLITPATLSVILQQQLNYTLQELPQLVIATTTSNMSVDSRFISYSHEAADGPSAMLTRLVQAVASTGSVLPFSTPNQVANVSWTINSTGPLLKCNPSNQSVKQQTARGAFMYLLEGRDLYSAEWANKTTLRDSDGIIVETDDSTLSWSADAGDRHTYGYRHGQIGYFGMSPGSPAPEPDVEPAPDWWNATANMYQVKITPEVWIAYADMVDGKPRASYLTCTLWNTSLSTTISYTNGVRQIDQQPPIYLNTLENPPTDSSVLVVGLQIAQCFAYFIAIAMYLIDGVDWSSPTKTIRPDSLILQSSLVDATDFDSIAASLNSSRIILGGNPDVVPTKNLSTLIEEFSLNVTMSMLSSSAYRLVSSAFLFTIFNPPVFGSLRSFRSGCLIQDRF
jgi:hypothetical protein